LRLATDAELEDANSIMKRNKITRPDELPTEERGLLEDLWAKVHARAVNAPTSNAS
jgi:hypothetical protein